MKKLYAGLLAVCAVLLCLSAQAAPADYDVILPDGYENSQYRYPVIFILPENGFASDDSGLCEALTTAMEQGRGMSMILIRPRFAQGDDVRAAMKQVIADIDSQYRTASDPACRAAAGIGIGGYLAYALALDPDSRISAAVSIRGNFAGEDNPWRAELGDVRETMEALHRADQKAFDKVYTYMDAPVDDPWTDQADGTAQLGSLMIGYGTGSRSHEFTLRPGQYGPDFLTESASRVTDRLTGWMLGDAVQAEMALDKAALSAEDEQLTAGVVLNVSDRLNRMFGENLEAQLLLSLTDPANGDVLSSAARDLTLSQAGGISDQLTVPNALTGSAAEARLSIRLLGAERQLASASVLRAGSNIFDGEWQAFSLADDWSFNYTARKQLDAAALRTADFADWSIVTPGLASWTKGFGNISEKNVSSAYGSDYFDFAIIGNAYYAKTFVLPEAFDTKEPVLSIGYVDDRCEVFLNGVRVGGTGMNESGASTRETTWAVFSHFEIDPELLVRGGENTVVVRAFNDLPFGAGGWYGGPIGLYSRTAFEAQFTEDSRFREETFESSYAAAAQGKRGTVETQYLVCLPEDYETSGRDYPTVYLLHQFNSDHTSYRTDSVDQLLDQGVRDGLFDGMIVVIPNSSEDSWWRGGWEKMITEELIPLIDSKYRTVPDARWRLTAGCSMGGQGAFAVALRNPDHFTGAISFFGAFSYGGASNPNAISAAESPEYLRSFALYFICGNQDSYGFGIPAIQLHQRLNTAGIPHRFFIENGGHDSAFYLPFFQDAFSYVRKHMYQNDGGAARLLHAAAATEASAVRVTLRAEESIVKYLYAPPASSYTVSTVPALRVKLLLTATQDGEEKAFVKTVEITADTLEQEILFDVPGADAGTEIALSLSVFDQVIAQ